MEIRKLTPAEVSNLWNSYLTNTMAVWVTRYLSKRAQNEKLHAILEYAEEIAYSEVHKSKAFLEEVNHPLPEPFDEGDVQLDAPAIYTDKFTLLLKHSLSQAAQIVYTLSFSTSTRQDIRQFYKRCVENSATLYDKLTEVMIEMGIHHPEMHIPIPTHIEKVHHQSYLGTLWRDRRPLNSQEVSQLTYNFRATEVLKTTTMSFAQVTKSNELKKHYQRGYDLYYKHLDVFQKLLDENDLPKLPTWESEVTDLKTSPFSERVMLYKMSLLASAASGRYGMALSFVQRKNLGVHFMRLMGESLQYEEDSLNLLIKFGYMDQLPLAKGRAT
ncbi:DUF3231 family protein [Caldalkalibacillus salinus]|uniref:DUF3231 family protein n=1 Tax=Caldalkalibacillus salinus TaxID=2803787 RepID=UPI0019223B18